MIDNFRPTNIAGSINSILPQMIFMGSASAISFPTACDGPGRGDNIIGLFAQKSVRICAVLLPYVRVEGIATLNSRMNGIIAGRLGNSTRSPYLAVHPGNGQLCVHPPLCASLRWREREEGSLNLTVQKLMSHWYGLSLELRAGGLLVS
jgi:hypothetical protein